MSRLMTVTVWSLFLLSGVADLAMAQEPPPLEPPSLEPSDPKPDESRPSDPKSTAPAQSNPARTASPKPQVRPMLAIPGVTAPAARPSAAYRSTVPGSIPPGDPPLAPTLDALPLPSEPPPARSPAGSDGFPLANPPSTSTPDALPPRRDPPPIRRPTGAGTTARPRTPAIPSPGDSIPLTIEPLDDEHPTGRDATRWPTAPRSPDGRAPEARSSPLIQPDEEPIRPQPAPRRGTGVLGRLFGTRPSFAPPAREESRTDLEPRRHSNPDSGQDPDVAARRRIERQVRATLGDKVRSFEVSVTGRNVTIVAQPSRFWLRRSVRRSLETLPALQGYRARIEVSE